MIEMNAQVLQHDGKPSHVIMPYDEFVSWNEQIEDELDIKLIRESQLSNVGKPRFTLEEVMKKFNVSLD